MKLGLPDAAFVRGKVPMTKQEIRILTLVKAQIGPRDIVYDIGAGSRARGPCLCRRAQRRSHPPH